MFIVLWVVMGGILGTCAAYMLIAGLQLARKADVSNASWHHALYGDDLPSQVTQRTM